MTFFFFLVVVGIVLFAIRNHHQRTLDEVFTTTSKRLNLALSFEGIVFRNPWLHGVRGGFGINVGPFSGRSNGKSGRRMGYRIIFRKPLELASVEKEAARRRIIGALSANYEECEVDGEGIFFARPAVPKHASEVISDIECLLREAEALVTKSGHTLDTAGDVVPLPANPRQISWQEKEHSRTPPPLPDRTPVRVEAELPNAEPLARAIETTPPETAMAAGRDSGESIFELVSDPPDESAELSSLDRACLDLFSAGRNRYEIGRTFESDYLGNDVTGDGVLRKVDRYSHDRVFGRGPGRIAMIDVRVKDPDGVGLLEATLCAELPADTAESSPPPSYGMLTGSRVKLGGTLVRCDPFTSSLYLKASFIE